MAQEDLKFINSYNMRRGTDDKVPFFFFPFLHSKALFVVVFFFFSLLFSPWDTTR